MDIPAGMPGIDVGSDIERNFFQQAQELAADAWGAKRSWFLVNGGSGGNHAVCLALAHSGRSVVVQRNAHSSTIDGMILAGLEPHFVAPEVDDELGIAHCATPEALERALEATPDAVVTAGDFRLVGGSVKVAGYEPEYRAAPELDEYSAQPQSS